jgi:uncharacterized protein (DUF3084 family)
MLGYFLVVVIIILGGAIATLGDRIGSRVGKARLSLFNLRPKNTAVIVTILTGAVISALTLGIVFAFSQQFRDALFRFDEIQKQSRIVQKQLDETQAEKDKIEGDLGTARTNLSRTEGRLKVANRSLVQAITREKRIEQQLKQLQSRYQQSKREISQFVGQAKELRSQIQSLRIQQNSLRVQRNQSQARLQQVDAQKKQLETAVAEAETAIAQAQTRLREVEVQKQKLTTTIAQERLQLQAANRQRQELEAEVQSLEANRQRLEQNVEFLLLGLRRGIIAIRTGQVLASAVVQDINTQTAAIKAIDALLLQARQNAIALSKLSEVPADQRIIQMRRSDVEQLIPRIGDGQSYVIRILAAASYLQGERAILVVPQLATNQVIYQAGTRIAQITVQPAQLTDEQLLFQINQLFNVVNEQAIGAGFLADPLTGNVGSFSQVNLFRFILALKDRNDQDPVQIFAMTTETVLTAGPLAVELVAIKDGQVILRSSPP